MLFAHGVVQWLAANTATHVYTIAGLGFTPKAIVFYGVGLGSDADTVSQSITSRRFGGIATASKQRCVGSQDQDAVDITVCTSSLRNDCIAMTLTPTTADGLLAFTAFTADGFTLTVNNQAPVDITVAWEAWGGDDIEVADIVDISEPAGTGTQNYSVTGFTSDGEGQALILFGVQSTAAANSAQRTASGFMRGAATGTAAAENVVVTGSSVDNVGTSISQCYGIDGECLAMISIGGGNPNARAALSAWGTNQFTLNWLARNTSNRRYIALAIKGGLWRAGSYTINSTVLNSTATVSGLPFAPRGVSIMSHARVKCSPGVSAAPDDYTAFGTGTSEVRRRTLGHHVEDAEGLASVNLILQYDQVLGIPGNVGELIRAFDIDAWQSAGFRIIVDAAHGSGETTEWQAYLTWGSVPRARLSVASDQFNRADSGDLGASWDPYPTADALKITSNRIRATTVLPASGETLEVHTATLPSDQWADVEVYTLVNAGGGYVGIVVRAADPPTVSLYYGYVSHTKYFGIGKYIDGGAWDDRNVDGVLAVSGDMLRVEAIGTEISLYVNNIFRFARYCGDLASGRVGLEVYAGSDLANQEADNWTCGRFAGLKKPRGMAVIVA